MKIQISWPKDHGVRPDDLLLHGDVEFGETAHGWTATIRVDTVSLALCTSLSAIYEVLNRAQPPYDRLISATREFVSDGESEAEVRNLNEFLMLYHLRTEYSFARPYITRDEDGLLIRRECFYKKREEPKLQPIAVRRYIRRAS